MDKRADNTFERVIRKFAPQSKLLRVWELKGGVSAQVTAFEIELPDGLAQKMVLRQHGDGDLRYNPHVTADEYKLLQLLHPAEMAVPEPYYLDQSGEIFATPYIIIEYVEGGPEFAPPHLPDLILQLATYLSTLHKLDCSHLDISFLPLQEKGYTQKLRERAPNEAETNDEKRIREIFVFSATWPIPQRNATTLLHGDFWPGNIIWRDGKIAAVIDWEDAHIGDPLADLANSRLEILFAFGIDAMHDFTSLYASLTPVDLTYLPYWDLCVALQPITKLSTWGLDSHIERAMREKLSWFVARAFEEIS